MGSQIPFPFWRRRGLRPHRGAERADRREHEPQDVISFLGVRGGLHRHVRAKNIGGDARRRAEKFRSAVRAKVRLRDHQRTRKASRHESSADHRLWRSSVRRRRGTQRRRFFCGCRRVGRGAPDTDESLFFEHDFCDRGPFRIGFGPLRAGRVRTNLRASRPYQLEGMAIADRLRRL